MRSLVVPAQPTPGPSIDAVTTAPVSSTTLIVTSLLTVSERKRVMANANTELLKYFISRPMRNSTEDDVYFAELANRLVSHLLGVNSEFAV